MCLCWYRRDTNIVCYFVYMRYVSISINQVRFRYVLILFCNQTRPIRDFCSWYRLNTFLLRTVTHLGYGYKRDPLRIRINHFLRQRRQNTKWSGKRGRHSEPLGDLVRRREPLKPSIRPLFPGVAAVAATLAGFLEKKCNVGEGDPLSYYSYSSYS